MAWGRHWRRIKPGQSGNPSGRAKELMDGAEAARAHTPLALRTLADIADDGKLQRIESNIIVADEQDLSKLSRVELNVLRKLVKPQKTEASAAAVVVGEAA